jgi:leucyl/phenylalanyl-tRNA--protein transferase
MIVKFPPLELADPATGLLAVGGDLEIDSLELAYRNGIFPWPLIDESLLWFAPPQRAILEFDEFHCPKRLTRWLQNSTYTFKVDADFLSVIKACARSRNRKNQGGSWITEEMINGYYGFHEAGYAHSFETYTSAGKLVGGMYGVLLDNYFAGESMFYTETNASKYALVNAVEYLKDEGLTWMDVQQQTPLLASFGAREIPRDEFMTKLEEALVS